MRSVKSKASERMLAILLVLAMVVSILPLSLATQAAPEDHSESFTVTVTDEDKNPIVNAEVNLENGDDTWELNLSDVTDGNGIAEFSTDEIKTALTTAGLEQGQVHVVVTMEGYDIDMKDVPVSMDGLAQNIEIILLEAKESTTIDDVSIEGLTLTYNGGPQELVSITELEGDTHQYYLDDAADPVDEIPTATDADTYKVRVVVSREGKDSLEKEVTTIIKPADIDDISIAGKTISYNEEKQELIELTGSFKETDNVIWSVNGEEEESQNIPTATAVGTYTVVLTVDRGSNYYKLITEPVTTNLIEGDLNLEGLTVKGLESIYMIDEHGTPVAQETVEYENKGDYTLMYQLDDGDLTVNESGWVTEIPTVTNAGSYIVWVKAVKDYYNDADVDITPAISAVAPYNVYVAQADQSFAFVNDIFIDGETGSEQVGGEVPYNGVVYDFGATDTAKLANGKITYAVKLDQDGIASIDANTGQLTVNYPGKIEVSATLSGNGNYKASEITYTLDVCGVVSTPGQYISFANEQVDYVLGTSDTIANQVANKMDEKIEGSISYELDMAPGVNINAQTGEVSVTDYETLAEAIRETVDGSLELTVTATKAGSDYYGVDTASYVISISFETAPSEPYKLPTVDGNNNWYRTEGGVVVTPHNGYFIAQKASEKFENSTTFSNEGKDTRYVYLKNKATGGITDRIEVVDENGESIKIDTKVPEISNMYIEFEDLSIVEKIGFKFGFYNPTVNIKFIVDDELSDEESGIEYVEWYYAKGGEATSSILTKRSGPLPVTVENGKYVAKLSLTATDAEQYRGKIAFKAYDSAGNGSNGIKYDENDLIIVIDTIDPTMGAVFKQVDANGIYNPVNKNGVVQHYFNGAVEYTFTIEEANFFPEDVIVEVTKDGKKYSVNAEWSEDVNSDEIHYGKVVLRDEGDYVVTASYKDQSKNVMVDAEGKEILLFKSEVITIDTTKPVIEVEYTSADRVVGNEYFYNNAVDVKFTVTEANFYAEDVKVSVTKNGEAFNYGTVTWTDKDAEDKTVGFFTLEAPADHSGDGHYVITVEYKDRSANTMTKYVSDVYTIDTTSPVISVDYQNKAIVNTLKDADGNDRKYYADTQTAVITINEHNFNANEVEFDIIAQDVNGVKLDAEALNTKTAWSVDSTGDVHTMKITYPGDANYIFDVAYTDIATNAAVDYAADHFTVDKTKPVNLKVAYSTSVLDTVLESVTFGFYNAKMTVTLTAEDPTSEINTFLYSYINAAGVSSANAELINEAINAADIKYSDGRKIATVTFEIPKMVLGSDNQFNGTVEFTAADRAGNVTDTHKETRRVIVDNIAPTAQVTYNDATNVVDDIAYYNGDINATVTITEANFYEGDVQVLVSKDGGAETAVTPTWSSSSADIHVGTFTLTEDGDYFVTINYTDKSSNAMATYTSQQLTIDTEIESATYTINGKDKQEIGGAYKGDVVIDYNFEDQNFDTKTIKLTRTRFDKVEDVTDEFINVTDNEKGGSGSFTIPSKVENDGIYVLTIELTDKADHTTESNVKFTVNRFGSVYEYSNDLVTLIKDGGQYIKAVDGDLVITEYNADRIIEGSLNILITRDGEAIDVDFVSNLENLNGQASTGGSGWYQYIYTIKASNFEQDGVYKISLTSEYAADDVNRNESTSIPTNSIDEQGNEILDTMTFVVDSTAPEIRNIVNLEEEIVNAQSLDVKYTVVDVGGLKMIEVILNNEIIDTITEFGDSEFSYSGQFTIGESTDAQTVQIRVTDMAGNVTDTAAEDFNTGDLYIFNDTVTVSTSFMVRWYANKPLFWGSIGGVILLTGAILFGIAAKRRKKEEA